MGHETIALLLTWTCIGAILCYPSSGVRTQGSLSSDDSKVQYCGNQLANAISFVCNGNYNTMDSLQSSSATESELRFPYKKREDARSFGRFRRRRGITDECCVKSCTFTELTSFCAP